MMTYRMLIPPDKVEQTRTFFKTRGGCVLWKNKEIGNPRGDIMTPATHEDGSPATEPHWAYKGTPQPLKPEEIGVRTETIVEPPPEWFPVCTSCEGTGKQPLNGIANARGISVRTLKKRLKEKPEVAIEILPGDLIQCWNCQGTGHMHRQITGQIRKYYWGRGLSTGSEVKAKRLAAKLGPDVKYDWEHIGYGRAAFIFYTEKIEPFTLGEDNARPS